MPAAGEVSASPLIDFSSCLKLSSSPLPREEREWRREGGRKQEEVILGALVLERKKSISSLFDPPGS
jgi:hypothetical protein